ncbi:hypothetical protein CcCBS67573_g02373 [Chytriomyces confervae]|uniref:Protein kinase domain-containing protein n=1 Tax=Chytriomyces confervae TaxID=246404 RepID=A0A507FKW4_9FUNG|nr:hypothetical protein CcCBS67573_g02373 [Chytriomyces confervae]
MSPRAQQNPISSFTTGLTDHYAHCNPEFNYVRDLNPKRVLTKPSKAVLNDGHDNADSDYILYVNDVLGSQEGQQLSVLLHYSISLFDGSNTVKFQILDLLGQGTFGQVVKCANIKTNEKVAVKVIKNKPAYYNQSLVEVAILDILNNKWDHSDKYHIVYMKDTFVFRNHLCIVFEMLSVNLYELIKQNQFRGLSTTLVRLFVQQILECLVLLSKAKIIHSDLKPENILLKSLDAPTIKVIDFGSACHENQTIYTYIQSRFYRSPEVLVGLPYTSSIDMWSLGCIAAELFLGLPLFPGTSEYNQVSRIGPTGWELKSMQAYMLDTGHTEQPSKQYFQGTTLHEIISSYPMPKRDMNPVEEAKERNDRLCFIDFLGGLLKLNPLERWSPQQAKLHPFVTGEEYTGPLAKSAVFPLQRPVFAPATVATSDTTGDAQSMDAETNELSTASRMESIEQQQHVQQPPVAVAANSSRRPRANTMIQAVPPQLQKIVTIQQQSGPNKVSLRNAAASSSGNVDTIPPVHLGGHTNPLSNSSLNNDEVVYSSSEKGKLPAASDHIDHGYTAGSNRFGGVSSAMQGSTANAVASYDAKYLANHYPLRKAVSETMYTTHAHFQQQFYNTPATGPPPMPMPSINHMPAESLGNMSGPSMHGNNASGGYYDGSHIPYDVLANMNHGYNPAVDASSNQQHPRMGEKGERKLGFASRAPSLPGLAEWDPFGNVGGHQYQQQQQQQQQQHAENMNSAPVMPSQYRRSSSSGNLGNLDYSPGADSNGGGPRESGRFENMSNSSPRFQHRGSIGQNNGMFPIQNGYASSPRSAFPASPRNAFQSMPQPQQQYYAPPHPYQQQQAQQQQAQQQQHQQKQQQQQQQQQQQYQQYHNGYEGNTSKSEATLTGYRGRSVSLSMNGQYPLNQPWNQPIQNQQAFPQTNGSGGNGGGVQGPGFKKRGAPPNISTALASSPQHFQQIYHQQPFSAAAGAGGLPSYSSGGPPSAYSNPGGYPYSAGGPMSASAADVSQIHPQRIIHPANIGMRRSSIQYGTSPSAFASSNYHGSIPSGLGDNNSNRAGSSGSFNASAMHAASVGGGGNGIPFSNNNNSGTGGGPGFGLDFTKSNIPQASPKSASALSGRALRFSNLPPSLSDAPLVEDLGVDGRTTDGNAAGKVDGSKSVNVVDTIMFEVVEQQAPNQ